MNILLRFPLYLMETLTRWASCSVVFMFLMTVSKACEAPSSPQCFRRHANASVYLCEWSMNTTKRSVTFDIYFNERKFAGIKETWHTIPEELLIKFRPVNISVNAHVGNSSCESPKRSVILGHTVKFDAPQNISVSWFKKTLSLRWEAAENHPASAEVWLRQDEHPTDLWEKFNPMSVLLLRKLTETTSPLYQVGVVNLLKHLAYQVQIRQRSSWVQNALWSNWSPVVTVPAELEDKPDVTMKMDDLNGTRVVMLSWKPVPRAAAVRGVTYSLQETSLHGCPCVKRNRPVKTEKHTYRMYVSYSAVNISVIATNPAGHSPPAVLHLPAQPAANLKACHKTSPQHLNRESCHEWYELNNEDSRPENVIILTRKNKPEQKKEVMNSIKDNVRYLYFEHSCQQKKPQTVQMCLFYQKEGAPNREPQGFTALSETSTSASLSWKAIPVVHQRGHLTNYKLCRVKIGPQAEPKECFNISASLLKFPLENLTPRSKYNISLAAVTQVGEGPIATVTINTLPEKPVNVWWSFGLLFAFLLISTLCTIILKRIKSKIFPPVPTPVIPEVSPCPPKSQEMLEGEEEVHELKLEKLPPEVRSPAEDSGETTVLRGEWDDGRDEEMENEEGDSSMSGETDDGSPSSTDQTRGSCREGEITDLEEADNEIAMLIYRNGLVFDLRTDSS